MLKALLAQHGGGRGRGTEGKFALVMDEAVIVPHGAGEDGKAEMSAVGRQVGMIRGDDRNIQKARRRQSRRTQYHRVDEMHNIRPELLQAANKKRAKEIEFEFWIKWQGNACCPYDFGSGILLYAACRAKQNGLVFALL